VGFSVRKYVYHLATPMMTKVTEILAWKKFPLKLVDCGNNVSKKLWQQCVIVITGESEFDSNWCVGSILSSKHTTVSNLKRFFFSTGISDTGPHRFLLHVGSNAALISRHRHHHFLSLPLEHPILSLVTSQNSYMQSILVNNMVMAFLTSWPTSILIRFKKNVSPI
jgi:hypothetical protein